MSIRIPNMMGEESWLGKSKAIVIDNKDPDHKGRVRVYSPVFGNTSFIPVITPDDGFFAVPDINTVVYVEADGGDKDYLIVTGVVNDGPDGNPDTPEDFRRQVPTNRGIFSAGRLDSAGKPEQTNSGHSVQLDDGLAISEPNGLVEHTKEESGVKIKTQGGHSIVAMEEGSDGSQQNKIQLRTTEGAYLSIGDSNDAGGQVVKISDKDDRYFTIDSGSDTIITESGTIKIGAGAVEPIILGNSWVTYNNAEIVNKLNLLIAAFSTLAASFASHNHGYLAPTGGSAPATTSGPTPSSTGAAPASAAVATPSLLAVKGKVE